jgi:NADPH-dependent 2,4-dienoyl-CoA reductase/sulfur reductase-like enzyme
MELSNTSLGSDASQPHSNLGPKSVAIVGSGLVGCLLGIYLRKYGFNVAFFESRADPRIGKQSVHLSLVVLY